MGMYRYLVLLFVVAIAGCDRSQDMNLLGSDEYSTNVSDLNTPENSDWAGKGALLLSRFKSYEELKSVIQIEYAGGTLSSDSVMQGNSEVSLTHRSGGKTVTSTLKSGVSESDFMAARGGFWNRVQLGLSSPYAVLISNDLLRVVSLARRIYPRFGEGDVAFYDLAEKMVHHISADDTIMMTAADLSEKGYLNTFNHITAQAFLTSIFSERLADFIADIHERHTMPELITGEFTDDQLTDIENGAVDNYIDMINNEWGQELGKVLRKKYNISRYTYWSPELLANYLNDIQNYMSWAFQIAFKPFSVTDEIVIRYSNKINRVTKYVSEMRKTYY